MKQGIHPQYVECTVTCSCGNTFKTHATVSEMKVELCNECHPFYTGQQKFVDTGGRVQRFADKFGGAAAAQLKKAEEQLKKAEETLEERKLVDRAKGLLMDKADFSEQGAFRWIQKTSMDQRIPKKRLAMAIIAKYGEQKSEAEDER